MPQNDGPAAGESSPWGKGNGNENALRVTGFRCLKASRIKRIPVSQVLRREGRMDLMNETIKKTVREIVHQHDRGNCVSRILESPLTFYLKKVPHDVHLPLRSPAISYCLTILAGPAKFNEKERSD